MHFYLAQLRLLEKRWEGQRIIQALGETVTANCVSWSPRVAWCRLACSAAAAALASVCTIYLMIVSIFVILPCLRDVIQLYKPRAVYHLGWGKWLKLDRGCMPGVLAGTVLADCFLMKSGSAFRLHPSSTLADRGWGAVGVESWQDLPNIGPATFVPSARKKIR